jgi:large subunit ribosomal protein L13
MEIIIDAENAVLGRLASFAAKKVLLDNKVIIVNAEKALITGNKLNILNDYLFQRRLGHGAQKGPHFYSRPEMIMRRTIRGMLPWKRTRGREAFKNVFCFTGIPEKYKGKEMVKFEPKEILNYTTLGEMSKLIRQKED